MTTTQKLLEEESLVSYLVQFLAPGEGDGDWHTSMVPNYSPGHQVGSEQAKAERQAMLEDMRDLQEAWPEARYRLLETHHTKQVFEIRENETGHGWLDL